MIKSYNSLSNTIDTQHSTHITSNPCYILAFEEWVCENHEAITEYMEEYPEEVEGLTRAEAELKLFNQGPGPSGIYNDDIIFKIELDY